MNEEKPIKIQKMKGMKGINRKESGGKLYVSFDLFYKNRTTIVTREKVNEKSAIAFRIYGINPGEKIGLVEYMVLKKTKDWYKRNNKKYNFFTIN